MASDVLWGDSDFRVILGHPKIEYDPAKEGINRKKHGYSLESAVDLLTSLVLPGSLRPFFTGETTRDSEVRHEHLTMDDSDNVVYMVTTMRENEAVRVISLRRANRQEIASFNKLMAEFINAHREF
jgi:uncharacterized DUF497 family protein